MAAGKMLFKSQEVSGLTQ